MFEDAGTLFCGECYSTLHGTSCNSCSLPVSGEILRACDKNYHPDCFLCCECACPLEEELFHLVSIGSKEMPMCVRDFALKFSSNQCPGCKQDVSLVAETNDIVNFNEQNWHRECLVCEHADCARPLIEDQGADLRILLLDGHKYCREHIKLYAPSCATCKQALVDSDAKVDCMDLLFHEACFHCTKCEQPFKQGSMMTKQGTLPFHMGCVPKK